MLLRAHQHKGTSPITQGHYRPLLVSANIPLAKAGHTTKSYLLGQERMLPPVLVRSVLSTLTFLLLEQANHTPLSCICCSHIYMSHALMFLKVLPNCTSSMKASKTPLSEGSSLILSWEGLSPCDVPVGLVYLFRLCTPP